MQIQTMMDVRAFMRKFGYIIYTGDVAGDVELIKEEVMELYQAKLLEKDDFIQLMSVISKEEEKLSNLGK